MVSTKVEVDDALVPKSEDEEDGKSDTRVLDSRAFCVTDLKEILSVLFFTVFVNHLTYSCDEKSKCLL